MKMEGEKPHRSVSSSSELFICFTSRGSSSNSSSSMKISSKSILSPGRTDKFRDGSSTLHSSLSRRLRSNGSMKGGQSSPMFPTGSKKKGCSFETPEPSSPKVTCIGQVRVKTKKQGKMRSRSKSKCRGEVSFRKTEQIQEGQQQQQECLPNRNQRWVHLPLSICEALRSFRAEFNCFVPCGGRSSCSSNAGTEREKGENRATTPSPPASSCGAVFARWLMTMQESEEEKRREMVGLVAGQEEVERQMVGLVGGEEEQEREKMEETKIEEKDGIEQEEEVSICIPPRNALLLMRCRSEPLRMSSFASRFWDSPIPKEEDEEEDNDDEDEEEEDVGAGRIIVVEVEEKEDAEEEEKKEDMLEKTVSSEENEDLKEESAEEKHGNPEKEEVPEGEHEIPGKEEELEEEYQNSEKYNAEEEHAEREEHNEEERVLEPFCIEVLEAPQNIQEENRVEEEEIQLQKEEEAAEEEIEEKAEERRATCSSLSVHQEDDEEGEAKMSEAEATFEGEGEGEEEKSADEKEKTGEISVSSASARAAAEGEEKSTAEMVGREEERERRDSKLPDCLLLMMCEPKLSMEVSKETWVCSTDFMRCRPRPAKGGVGEQQQQQGKGNEDGGGEERKRVSTDSNPAHHPPPPAASNPPHQPVSMATVIEQKLVKAAAYEPFVLTRCKSEPMRSSAKLAPEACFWKTRKLAHAGVGAAGVGF